MLYKIYFNTYIYIKEKALDTLKTSLRENELAARRG